MGRFCAGYAGYRANAQEHLQLCGKRADIFLLHKMYFSLEAEEVEPLIVHELAHLLEQTKKAAQPEGTDAENAKLILDSLREDQLTLHDNNWALHLAAGARRMVANNFTNKNIRDFLNLAVPEINRRKRIEAKL